MPSHYALTSIYHKGVDEGLFMNKSLNSICSSILVSSRKSLDKTAQLDMDLFYDLFMNFLIA